MKLLDRYVIRNFLQVYLYCIAGFISIWLIFDISDNISTFIDEHFGFALAVRYYATQVPEVFIILLPVSAPGIIGVGVGSITIGIVTAMIMTGMITTTVTVTMTVVK